MTLRRRGISAFNVAYRSALLASEVAVGLALLAIIVFIAAFTSLIRQTGRDTLATAVTVSGAVFVALGFISQAAETALLGVADAGDQSALLALHHPQGRIPIVWTITALTGRSLSPDYVPGYCPPGWVSRDSSPPACSRSARCPAS